MSPQSSSAALAARTARTAIRLEPADAELRCELARWALSEGRSLNVDAATAILAARRARSSTRSLLHDNWTAAEVRQTLRTVVPQLWRLHGLGSHPPLGDSMRTYLSFLDATSRRGPLGPALATLLDATLVADVSRPAPAAAPPDEPARVIPLGSRVRTGRAGVGQVRPK